MTPFKDISIKGFLETSFVDWPGNICSVIVLPSCNFRCRYCHNTDLVLRPGELENIDFHSILKRLSELKGWIDGVCVSGGEPTLHSSLPKVLSALKKEGFSVKLDTNGSNPKKLLSLMEDGLVDFVAMDVKSSLDETSYCTITQTPHMLESVKKSIRILLQGKVPHEFRCTVVPSYHGAEDIYKLAMELNGAKRLRIQNFNPTQTLDPSLQTLKPFAEADICHMQEKVNKLISI